MKLTELKKEGIQFKNSDGTVGQITFMMLAVNVYKRMNKNPSLSLDKFIMANKNVLEAEWEHIKKQIVERAIKNNKPHNKLIFKVKQFFRKLFKRG